MKISVLMGIIAAGALAAKGDTFDFPTATGDIAIVGAGGWSDSTGMPGATDLAEVRKGIPAEKHRWDANVVAWRFDAAQTRAEATGVDDMAVLATGSFSKVSLSAEAVPRRCRSKDWSTFGIGITDNNYWRLSLVQSPRGKDGGEGRRFFELCEMREGRWHAQNRDRHRLRHRRQDEASRGENTSARLRVGKFRSRHHRKAHRVFPGGEAAGREVVPVDPITGKRGKPLRYWKPDMPLKGVATMCYLP